MADITSKFYMTGEFQFTKKKFVQGDYRPVINFNIIPKTENYNVRANFLLPDRTVVTEMANGNDIVIPTEAMLQVGDHEIELIVIGENSRYTVPQKIKYEVLSALGFESEINLSQEKVSVVIDLLDMLNNASDEAESHLEKLESLEGTVEKINKINTSALETSRLLTVKNEEALKNMDDLGKKYQEGVAALEDKKDETVEKAEEKISLYTEELLKDPATKMPNNSIPASKFSTKTEADKIKMANLADEVKRAIAGTAPVSPVIGDGEVSREKIADGAISLEKIGHENSMIINSFTKIEGLNLINPKNVVIGKYINPSGNLVSGGTQYSSSGKIPVKPNTTYYKSANPVSWSNLSHVRYDKDMNFIDYNLNYTSTLNTGDDCYYVDVVLPYGNELNVALSEKSSILGNAGQFKYRLSGDGFSIDPNSLDNKMGIGSKFCEMDGSVNFNVDTNVISFTAKNAFITSVQHNNQYKFVNGKSVEFDILGSKGNVCILTYSFIENAIKVYKFSEIPSKDDVYIGWFFVYGAFLYTDINTVTITGENLILYKTSKAKDIVDIFTSYGGINIITTQTDPSVVITGEFFIKNGMGNYKRINLTEPVKLPLYYSGEVILFSLFFDLKSETFFTTNYINNPTIPGTKSNCVLVLTYWSGTVKTDLPLNNVSLNGVKLSKRTHDALYAERYHSLDYYSSLIPNGTTKLEVNTSTGKIKLTTGRLFIHTKQGPNFIDLVGLTLEEDFSASFFTWVFIDFVTKKLVIKNYNSPSVKDEECKNLIWIASFYGGYYTSSLPKNMIYHNGVKVSEIENPQLASTGFKKENHRMIMSKDMFVVKGYGLEIYSESMFSENDNVVKNLTPYIITKDSYNIARTYYIKDNLHIDGDKFKGAVRIGFKSNDLPNSFFRQDITIHSKEVSDITNKNPTILCIGDSITNRNQPRNLKNLLTRFGVNAEMIGTMANNGGESGEGREGWEYENFIGADNRQGNNGTAINVQTTFGKNTSNLGLNPFLKLATSQDKLKYSKWCFRNTGAERELSYEEDTDKTGNFYIFDMAHYIEKNGFTNPDIITIALSTNDIWQNGTNGLPHCEEALEIMLLKIKDALPSAKVGVMVHVWGNNLTGTGYLKNHVPSWIDKMNSIIERLNLEGIYVVPLWVHGSRENLFPLALTGKVTGDSICNEYTMSDYVHYSTDGEWLYADVNSQFVANML